MGPGQYEYFSFFINPVKWLINRQESTFARERSFDHEEVLYPFTFDGKGNVWIKKEDKWHAGKINKDTIRWDGPITSAYSDEHKFSIDKKGLILKDE
jgi:uncharacterized protein (AIM24 family)